MMEKGSYIYRTYVEILKEELICAMGCTEPIAVAYCAAKARSVLGCLPERVEIEASGSVIKNVKSVIVPNTDGRKGLGAASAAGIVGGDENAGLLVISRISEESKKALGDYLSSAEIHVSRMDTPNQLDILITVYGQGSSASVRITNEHTNIVEIRKNDEVLFRKEPEREEEKNADAGDGAAQDRFVPDHTLLTVEGIYEFAKTCDLEDVRETLERQIACNEAIAAEGLTHDYGAGIGKLLLKSRPDDITTIAKAYAAAGSDARMNGCEMPVVINSGSGNQGMTASLPVIQYAKYMKADHDTLLRALLVSDLMTIHGKTSIGRLSAYCGAVTAGAGAGAGIAFLHGADAKGIGQTMVNALAITSGIVCDGAKASCAAKIASAVEAGILGYDMYLNGQRFMGGDGLVLDGVEDTIENFGYLGRVAMAETNQEIIRMMTEGR